MCAGGMKKCEKLKIFHYEYTIKYWFCNHNNIAENKGY